MSDAEEIVRLPKAKADRMTAWCEIEATVDLRTTPLRVSPGRTWKREDLYDRDERLVYLCHETEPQKQLEAQLVVRGNADA